MLEFVVAEFQEVSARGDLPVPSKPFDFLLKQVPHTGVEGMSSDVLLHRGEITFDSRRWQPHLADRQRGLHYLAPSGKPVQEAPHHVAPADIGAVDGRDRIGKLP